MILYFRVQEKIIYFSRRCRTTRRFSNSRNGKNKTPSMFFYMFQKYYLYFIYNLVILLCFFQLLAKEQEVEEKTHHLKAAIAEIDSLKSEVSRLRRYEDELNNVQVSKIFDNSFEFNYHVKYIINFTIMLT